MAVYYALIWPKIICIIHIHNGSVLPICIKIMAHDPGYPRLNAVHPQLNVVQCIRHHSWHNIIGSMLCRPQFMAQYCASGITIWLKPVHHVSILLNVVHPRLNLCIMHQYGLKYSTNHHTKLATSYFVHFLFCYFVCG